MASELNRRPLIAAGTLLGVGMGGFVDGILFHQILQLHNMLPTTGQKNDLLGTMERFNAAASYAAKVGFEAKVFGQVTLHRLAYREIRGRFGLSSQMAVRAIAKAVECFQRDKTKCPVFEPRSAICYDQRVLSFKGLTTVSLWALSVKCAPGIGPPEGHRYGTVIMSFYRDESEARGA